MIFRQLTRDDLGCASYLVGDEDAGVAAVVDPKTELQFDEAHIPGAVSITSRRTRFGSKLAPARRGRATDRARPRRRRRGAGRPARCSTSTASSA
jgi:hypothetical protein